METNDTEPKTPESQGEDEQARLEVVVESKLADDAIAEGLARLGISRSEAEIEIIDEGAKGILGFGAKNVTVRVRRKTDVDAIVRAVVETLVSGLDPDVRVELSSKREGEWHGEIETEELALVLGRRGRTLDAIQSLASAIVSRRLGNRARVHLDSSGFRQKRKAALEDIAHESAEDVVATGEAIHLEPMSSFDRKIIHAELADHPEVETMSEDSGSRRHVVIRLKSGSGGRGRPARRENLPRGGRSRSRRPRGRSERSDSVRD